jgi:Cu(I)/Ag(I) efflux system membrane fusion protein
VTGEGERVPPGIRTMAVVRWVIVALAAGLALFAFAGVLHRPAGPQSGQLYYCPMHPSVVMDHPGECPICGMTLVPKQAGSVPSKPPIPGLPALSAVDLSPERIQLIGMKTAKVQRQSLGGELRTVGVVAPSERGLSQVTVRFTGWVEKLTAATGERVRRGQVLATIYSPELLKAEQELLVARGWGAQPGKPDELTASLGESARQRLVLMGISEREIDEVVRTGKATVALPLRSPADGFVVARSAVVGGAVQPGTVLFDIADLSKVWVNADVYEQDLARVAVGQEARLELAAFPGQSLTGRVQQVSPVLEAQNRTMRVRVELKNRFDASGPRLRPGMYGTVFLALPATTGLMVPSEAVVDTGENKYVFVATGGGHFEPRPVKVGGQMRDRMEILAGLAEGDVVVTTGNFLLDSESKLRAAIEGHAH